MSDDWFDGWVDLHCQATGANAAARDAILANRDNFVDRWNSTAAELGEVTARLVGSLRTPKFPNEHCDAVGRELVALRAELADRARKAARGFDDGPPACDACGGDGLVSVPHPRCVSNGRMIRDPETGAYLTGSVLCDRPHCDAGRLARDRETSRRDDKPRRLTLGALQHRLGGCDLVAMLRDHEREQARLARETHPRPGGFPSIAAALRGVGMDPGRRGAA